MNYPVQGFPPAPAAPTPAPAPQPTVVVQGTPTMSAPPIPMSGVVPPPTAAPAGAPAAPAPAPAAPAPFVFQGDNLPPELRGATPEQVVDYYNKLRTYYFQTVNTAPPVPQTLPAAAPQPAPPPPVEKPTAADFWSNPIDTIERVVQGAVAPVTHATMQDSIIRARNTIASSDPNYAAMEGEVLQQLQGVANEALTDPRTWELAYNMVLGRRYRQGQLQAPTVPAATPAPTPAPVPTRFAPTTFFSEPAGANGTATAQNPLNDTAKQEAARKLGMTYEQYTNWSRMLGGKNG